LFLQQSPRQSPGSLGISSALDDLIENVTVLINGTPKPVFSAIEIATSSRCQMSWREGRLRRGCFAYAGPNFRRHRQIASYEAMIPRSSSISSTRRKLSGNLK
jgi:hypothetical protein